MELDHSGKKGVTICFIRRGLQSAFSQCKVHINNHKAVLVGSDCQIVHGGDHKWHHLPWETVVTHIPEGKTACTDTPRNFTKKNQGLIKITLHGGESEFHFDFDAKDGETYYIKIWEHVGIWKSRFDFLMKFRWFISPTHTHTQDIIALFKQRNGMQSARCLTETGYQLGHTKTCR